jgi:hypothetical protein
VAYKENTTYIGTTSIALNRTSGIQTLSGVSIDGNAGSVTNGVYTTGAQSISGIKTFKDRMINDSGPLIVYGSRQNEGNIHLSNTTCNYISFNASGVGSPNGFSRSLGTKIILSPSPGTSSSDMGVGVESSALWFSVPNATYSTKWYSSSVNTATLTGSGVFTVAGATSQINVDNLRLDGNTIGANTNNTDIQILSSGAISNIFLGPIPPTIAYPGEQGYRVTADSFYVFDSFGFGESSDIVGDGIKFTYANGISTLMVNNGGGNGGSAFKAVADSGADIQGRFQLLSLASNTYSKKINEILSTTTSNNTANIVLVRSSTGAKLIIPAQSTWCFVINLSAYNYTDHIGAAWIFRGAIRRNNSGGTTIIGTVAEDSWKEGGMSSASANVVANDTDESLDIRVTGLSGTNIRWTASVDLSQANN